MTQVPSQRSGTPPGDEHGTSSLNVNVGADVRLDRARSVLGPGRSEWLGEPVDVPADGVAGRYLLDLELRVSDTAPRVAFRKAAFVDVGPLEADGERLWLDISWKAANMTPLFPVFAGRLSWSDGRLELNGFYAPPGGGVGLVADRLVLNVAARATGRRLLERIAEAMTRGDAA